jgi:hypothetical protein
MVFGDSLKIYIGVLGIMWYLKKLAMYNTWSVTLFSTIEGLPNPHCPPFFSLRLWVRFQAVKKKK